jgi:hypothetical protein
LAHQQSAATAFCSSYLNIPQSTKTSTTVTIVLVSLYWRKLLTR